MKEKLNLFMKNQLLENGELYERFGINPQIFSYDNQCGSEENFRFNGANKKLVRVFEKETLLYDNLWQNFYSKKFKPRYFYSAYSRTIYILRKYWKSLLENTE